MKNLPKILNLVFCLTNFLICSCNFDRDNKIHPRLPVAKNCFQENKSDSCCFSISIRDNSILIADNDTSCYIKEFSQVDSFLCHLIKSNKFKYSYPIVLKIDSLTPYTIVDNLIEKLQQIGFNSFYFKTFTKGFKLAFPEKESIMQEEVVNLYGQNYTNKIHILDKCSRNENSKKNEPDIDAPPPPPPPPSPLFLFNGYGENVANIDTSKFSFVGFINNNFIYNTKQLNPDCFRKAIYNKIGLCVDMSNKNHYKDFIKIIDMIVEVRNKKLNDFSLKIHKRKFDDLNEEQQTEIKRQYSLSFMIRNFAIQNYFRKRKQ